TAPPRGPASRSRSPATCGSPPIRRASCQPSSTSASSRTPAAPSSRRGSSATHVRSSGSRPAGGSPPPRRRRGGSSRRAWQPARKPVRRPVRRARLGERRLDSGAVALLRRVAEPLHRADDGVVLVEPLLRRLLLVLRRPERAQLLVALACEREGTIDVGREPA